MTSILEQTKQRYEAITGKAFDADADAVHGRALQFYGQLSAKTANAEPTNAPEKHYK